MHFDTELDKKLLIFAAEQFLVFNDENPEAYDQFIEFYNKQFTHEGVLLTDDIASPWEPYEYYNIRYICQLIQSLKESIKKFMTGLSLHNNADYFSFIKMNKNKGAYV